MSDSGEYTITVAGTTYNPKAFEPAVLDGRTSSRPNVAVPPASRYSHFFTLQSVCTALHEYGVALCNSMCEE